MNEVRDRDHVSNLLLMVPLNRSIPCCYIHSNHVIFGD